jgi:hypothetical protein
MSTFLHIPNLMIENFQKMGRFHPDFGVVAVLHQSRLSSQPVVAELGSLSPKKVKSHQNVQKFCSPVGQRLVGSAPFNRRFRTNLPISPGIGCPAGYKIHPIPKHIQQITILYTKNSKLVLDLWILGPYW